MKQEPSQATSATQTPFDARTAGWSAELRSVQKRVNRRVIFAATVILVSIFVLWIGLSQSFGEISPVALIGGGAIGCAVLLLLFTRKMRSEAVERIASDIRQGCQDEGLEKQEVVKALYTKNSDYVICEILRAVDPETTRMLAWQEARKATSAASAQQAPGGMEATQTAGSLRSADATGTDDVLAFLERWDRVAAMGTGTGGMSEISQMVQAGDVNGLSTLFQQTGSWDTRETVVVALQNISWGKGGSFDRAEMVEALKQIERVCATSSSGGSFRTNCLDAARKLLSELSSQ
jgi:hypothetical protein